MSFEDNPADDDPHGECWHEIERLQRALADEAAIVDRVWKLLGVNTYAEAQGKSIYDLVAELRRKADLWERLHDSRTKEAEHAKTHCCGCDMPRADCVCNVT